MSQNTNHSTDRIIVTSLSKSGSVLKSELWETEKVKGLGFPFRWTLERTLKGVRIRDLISFGVKEIAEKDLQKELILLGEEGFQIKLHPVRYCNQELSWRPRLASPESVPLVEDPQYFKRVLTTVFSAVVVAILGAQVIPTPHQEELIPAQFAKVILTPMRNAERQASESHSRAVNVVQAFQTGVVKKSTQALLKASVASLLAKTSPFSMTRSNVALQGLFDSKHNKQLGLAGAAAKPLEVATLNVGAMGGKGSAGAVGYGSGEHAGVKGQGSLMVSLNTLDATVDEGLSKDEVGKVIHSHISEVRYCYESAMIKNPDVQGKLVVSFVIRPVNGIPGIGTVKSAQVNTSTMGDAFLDECIINRLAQWKFPKPRGGVEVAVAYPFIFKSLGK
jgi:hypothetical protein